MFGDVELKIKTFKQELEKVDIPSDDENCDEVLLARRAALKK